MYTKFLKSKLISLWSVSAVFLLTFVANGCTSAPSNTWRDDFNGDRLNSTWVWKNSASANWSLSDGFLRIPASDTFSIEGNWLWRTVDPGDFTLKTRVVFEPTSDYQVAGLVIYQDDANFMQLVRGFCDNVGVCVGNGVYFDNIQGDTWGVGGNFASQVDNPKEVYLRLERRGEMVKGFYSSDGASWTEMGTHPIPPDFQVKKVGLAASQDINHAGISADFDFFELTKD